MAELADAADLKSAALRGVQVQVLFRARGLAWRRARMQICCANCYSGLRARMPASSRSILLRMKRARENERSSSRSAKA